MMRPLATLLALASLIILGFPGAQGCAESSRASSEQKSGHQPRALQVHYYFSSTQCTECATTKDSVERAVDWLYLADRISTTTIASASDVGAAHYWKSERTIARLHDAAFRSVAEGGLPLLVHTDSVGRQTRFRGEATWLRLRDMATRVSIDTAVLRRAATAAIQDNEDYFRANGFYAERAELLDTTGVRERTPLTAYHVASNRKSWWTAEIAHGRFRCVIVIGAVPRTVEAISREAVTCA